MRRLMYCVLGVFMSTSSFAYHHQFTNPHLPYPPACAQIPDPTTPAEMEGRAVKFFDQEVSFYTEFSSIPLILRVYRAACSEPNRSLIWLEFTLPARFNRDDLHVMLPVAVAEFAPGSRKGMNLASAPNGWGSGGWPDREATYLSIQAQGLQSYSVTDNGKRRWLFLLDNGPTWSEAWWEVPVTPSEYNGAFKLWLRYPPYDYFSIDIPAAAELLPEERPALPVNGRLSGIWVAPGAADQGMLLSISEKILPDDPSGLPNRPDMPMVVFFAHYTFDGEGRLLWLTGAAEFLPGASQVTIPIQLVTKGEFRGSKLAERKVIGSVVLKPASCNDMGFEYDYSGVGLGKGERRLERLFSLEIAGYDCRDYEARFKALH